MDLDRPVTKTLRVFIVANHTRTVAVSGVEW